MVQNQAVKGLVDSPISAHAGVQIRQQRRHLLIGKPAFKGGHHSPPGQYLARD